MLSLGAVLVLTRLIGPTDYGLYAAAYQVTTFLALLARLGVDAWLVCRERDTPEGYDQAFTIVAVSGILLATAGLALTAVADSLWNDPRFVSPVRVMLLILPITVLSAPAQARLERSLRYRAVAALELTGQLAYLAVAFAAALAGAGVGAPIAGYLTWQLWTWIGAAVLARQPPRWHWSRAEAVPLLRFAAGYSASRLIGQTRTLVNPVVVGGLLGPAAVGIVALAIRIGEALSFLRSAIWRIGLPALSRVQHDPRRFRAALEDAMGYQVLAVGPFLAVFALVAPAVVPAVFGERWQHVTEVFPPLAVALLIHALYNPTTAAMHVKGRNGAVLRFYVAHFVVFATASYVLVDAVGIAGYGWAELVAIGTYAVLHRAAQSTIGFGYAAALPWLIAFVPPMFAPLVDLDVRFLLWLPAAAALCLPAARRQLTESLRVVANAS